MAPKSIRRVTAEYCRTALTVMVCTLIGAPGALGAAARLRPDLQDRSKAVASGAPMPLEPGRTVDREIGGYQKHEYQIALAEKQYASVIFEQRGIDVILQFLTSDGKVIAVNEGRVQGQERAEIVADAAGSYRLVVRAAYPGVPAGRYAIRIMDIRAATDQDRLLHAVNKLSTEASGLLRSGEYEKARTTAVHAVELAEKALGEDNVRVGSLLSLLGYIQRQAGEYVKAEQSLKKSIAINEKGLGREHPETIDSINTLGLVYRSTNDHAKAERLFQEAVDRTERTLGAGHPSLVTYLANLAALHADLGDQAQVERELRRALVIAETTLDPNDPVLARVIHNLGSYYHSEKQYDRAEPLLQRALEIQEATLGPQHPTIAETLQSLGVVLRERKNYPRALELYQRALEIRQKALGPEHPTVGNLLNNIANIYKIKGDYAKALEIYQRVVQDTERSVGPYNALRLLVLGNIARTYAAQGDIPNAIMFQSRVDSLIEAALTLDLTVGSERQKLAYIESLAERNDRTISLNVSLAPNEQAASALAALVVLQRKGRVLDAISKSLIALRQRSDTEDRNLLDQFNSTTAQLARLVLSGAQTLEPEERRKQIRVLEEQREKLESEISHRSAEFQSNSQTVTLAAVQSVIPADSALIEFAVYRPFDPKAESNNEAYGRNRYVAYVLRAQGRVQWKELGDAEEIDAAITRLRQALRDPNREVKRLARVLDEKVMQPVRELVGNATRLLISPDGELNLLPFGVLIDERGDYLLERYSISYLTSGRDLLRMQVPRQSNSAQVVIADPMFGNPPAVVGNRETKSKGNSTDNGQRFDYSQVFFTPLPGVSQEVRALRELLPNATFLTKELATKNAVQRLNAPSILHIATHGFFLPDHPSANEDSRDVPAREETLLGKWAAYSSNPLLRSGLALAGANQPRNDMDTGILTALEASGLNLWGTKLVVLSACDTGVGVVRNGEGVYGLRRALVLAGAETQVMSLWPVPDGSTRELMVGYYKGLVQGRGRGEALRQVQLQMLRSKHHNHPYHWASFIQIGEWANLEGRR
jgi:CHAT domain-containing protein/Tfp pilus assembly protein PilF